ncbi:hypothetical protein [Streptococcus sp. CSL10205-OR2]|uniref:hypothetical protein n=1 Tax=Streptococcus sp. CSL10205-OR2 TaxID=2980558 RepID=UPI0021D850A0|nr:hypothetical protein [Streptococcus sp. CSL10205-OR2]MCU9533048.1 hypothetical protein [Streptococcus sp. CSL10205-OR2]
MKSVTKIRQSIRTGTIAIMAINIFSIIMSMFSIWSIYFTLNNIDQIAANDPILADVIRESATPVFFVQMIVGIIILIAISFLCFQNLKRLKQEEMVKKLPYYIGIAYTLFNIILTIITAINSGAALSLYIFILPVIITAIYAFTLYKVSELEDNNTQEDSLNI